RPAGHADAGGRRRDLLRAGARPTPARPGPLARGARLLRGRRGGRPGGRCRLCRRNLRRRVQAQRPGTGAAGLAGGRGRAGSGGAIRTGVRLHLDQVPWTRVAELAPSRTVVFVLSGPLEQHGPHLPLGTDLFQAALVRAAIPRRVLRSGWNVLLAPPLPYTTAVLSRSYPGSVSIHRAHAVDFFGDLLTSFAAHGLVNQVVISQHMDPPHVLAWEEACGRAAEAGARPIEGYERLIFDDRPPG